MLHRIAIPELGIAGLNPNHLRRCLSFLHDKGYQFISLDEAVTRSLDNSLDGNKYVAFTLDDGNFEQVKIAANLFKEFNCPSTCFLITGYVDGTLWPWDYKLVYLQNRIHPGKFVISIANKKYTIDDSEKWAKPIIALIRKHAPQDADEIVNQILTLTNADIPLSPPSELSPTNWQDVRAAEKLGMRFGAHTISHRNLCGPSTETITREVIESIERVNTQCANPSKIFCYPSGKSGEFDERAIRAIMSKGMIGGLSAEPGFLHAGLMRNTPHYRYTMPRMTIANSMDEFKLSISWLQYVRERLARPAIKIRTSELAFPEHHGQTS